MSVNLIPFPREQFFLPGLVPLTARGTHNICRGKTVAELINALFERESSMVVCDPRYGRYHAAATAFRGQMSAAV